jgi:hypothetical protein
MNSIYMLPARSLGRGRGKHPIQNTLEYLEPGFARFTPNPQKNTIQSQLFIRSVNLHLLEPEQGGKNLHFYLS